MAQQIINVGDVANDGQGDPLRDAFIKCNDNFTELYNTGGITGIQNGNSNIAIAEDSTINMSSTGVANVFVVSETGTTTLGLMAGNVVSVTGNVTGNYIIGNGRFLTDVQSSADAGTLTGQTLSSNVIYSSLTTVGTLTSLSVSGNAAVTGVFNVSGAASFGNSISAQSVSTTGNITGNNIISLNAVSFPSLNLTGNLAAANVNANGVFSTGVVSAGGNLIGGNVLASSLISSGNLTLSATGTLHLNPTGNIDAHSHWINNLANPAQSQDAATKYYVDSVVSGLSIHPSANAATTSDLAVYTSATVNYNNGADGVGATLSIVGNTLSILDGVPLSANDRLLIKNEANAVYNGVYVLTTGSVLTRATDFDTTTEAAAGSYVFVSSGTENGATSWTQLTTNPVIGVSNILFNQFSGGITSYGAGTGLALDGTIFSIANTGVTASSYGDASNIATFTVNSQGQLTAAGVSTVVAPAAYISGTTLSANVVNSSLTSVGTLNGLAVSGAITSTTITASGNVVSSATVNTGSLSLSGNVISALRVTSNVTGGNLFAVGVVSAAGSIVTGGNITGGNLSAGGNVNGANISASGSLLAGGLVSSTGNVVAAANVSATYFIGNGSLLTGLAASYSNVNVAAYLPVYGGNIAVDFLDAAGNITSANIIANGSITASGTVIGSTVSATANIVSANVITSNVSVSGPVDSLGNITSLGNISGAYLLGDVSAASGLPEAYSNAKVVANLAALGSNPVSTTGNITASYFIGNVSLASGFPAGYGNSNVVANLAALGSNPVSTTGNITAGHFIGDGSALSSITGGNVTGTVSSATSAGTATYVTNSAQANITSVGTLSALTVSGNTQINSLGVGTPASGTTGEIRATDNITAYYSSDAKFKENIRPIPNAVTTVEAIGGKLFDWTDEYIAARGGEDGYFITKSDFGVVAQDVQRVFPMAVRRRPDGSLAVDYDKLCALAFAAVVELSAEIKRLKGQ